MNSNWTPQEVRDIFDCSLNNAQATRAAQQEAAVLRQQLKEARADALRFSTAAVMFALVAIVEALVIFSK